MADLVEYPQHAAATAGEEAIDAGLVARAVGAQQEAACGAVAEPADLEVGGAGLAPGRTPGGDRTRRRQHQQRQHGKPERYPGRFHCSNPRR